MSPELTAYLVEKHPEFFPPEPTAAGERAQNIDCGDGCEPDRSSAQHFELAGDDELRDADAPTCSRPRRTRLRPASHSVSAAKQASSTPFGVHRVRCLGILRILWKASSALLWLGSSVMLFAAPAGATGLTQVSISRGNTIRARAQSDVHDSPGNVRDKSCRAKLPLWLHGPGHDSNR